MIKLRPLIEQISEPQRVLFVGDSSTTSKSSYANIISKSKKIQSSISAGGDNTSDILDNFKKSDKDDVDIISVMSHSYKKEDANTAIENLKRLFTTIKDMDKKLVVVISPDSTDKTALIVNDWLMTQTISDELIKSDSNASVDDVNTSRNIAKMWISNVLVQNQPVTPKKTKSTIVAKPKKAELQKDLDKAVDVDNIEQPKSGISLAKMIKPAATVAAIGGAAINYSSNVLSNAAKAIEFFVNKGLTPEQASGIAGNLAKESNFNPTAVGDNGSSYGIAQWHNERWDKLKSWSAKNGKNSADFEAQLEFLWWELENTAKSSLMDLKNQSTPYDAAYSFAKKFERPSVISNTRMKNAENFFNSYTQSKS
jgi:hypothetical protein